MLKHQKNLIQSVLIFTSLLFLASCGEILDREEQKPPTVEIRTVEVKPPKPIVPEPDPLKLREFEWVVVTPDNIDEVFSSASGEKVLFALTTDGYESISLNLVDIRILVEQQKLIIALYENQF